MPETRNDVAITISETAEVERLIANAQSRSRKIRIVTLALLLGLICVGVFTTFSNLQHRKEDAKRSEELKKQEEALRKNEELQRKLALAAENSTKASAYIASGAYKAGKLQWKAALKDYDTALALDPDNPSALNLEGYLRLRMGQTQEAEAMLRKAVEIDPDDIWSRYNFALALWATNNKSEALSQVQEILGRDQSFKSKIAKDPQFHSFRSDPSFRELMKP